MCHSASMSQYILAEMKIVNIFFQMLFSKVFWINGNKSTMVQIMLMNRWQAITWTNYGLDYRSIWVRSRTLHWRHNESDGVSNHQPHDCLLKRLFGRRSKKTSKLRVTGLYVGNSPGPVNSPHKGPVTRKMFTFDGVIMSCGCLVTWFCYQLIAKPGNKTATVSWPDP